MGSAVLKKGGEGEGGRKVGEKGGEVEVRGREELVGEERGVGN